MFNVGPGELVAILALALIVLGPQRLPEAVRTVGRVVGELRRISSGFQEELRNALDDSDVERDIDRLRAKGDGRDGEDQRELPLDDQPELPLGSVQYPSGFEPIDVDPIDTTTGDTAAGDVAANGDTPDVAAPEPVDTLDVAAADDDSGADVTDQGRDDVRDTDVDTDVGDDRYADEPDKNPAIDVDPAEPYEPPSEPPEPGGDGTGNGDGERAVS